MLEDLGDSGEAIPIPNVSAVPILTTRTPITFVELMAYHSTTGQRGRPQEGHRVVRAPQERPPERHR